MNFSGIKSKKLRVILSFLTISVGFLLFGIYAWSLRSGYPFPREAYWLSFVLVSLPLLHQAIFWKDHSRLRLVYLLCFSLIIHLQYAVVDTSQFLSSMDAVGDYSLTEKVIANAQWSTGIKSLWMPEYVFYPVTNFIYATASIITGIPLILVVKYLFIFRSFVVPPIIERWLRSFFDNRIAYLATAFFLSSPGAMLFPHKETFAVIFFFLAIYAISAIAKAKQYVFVGLLSVITLFMTHHFTSYIFVGLLTALYFVRYVFKRARANDIDFSSQLFTLCYVLFFAWIVFIAWTLAQGHAELLFETFVHVITPQYPTSAQLMPLYPFYERITIWAGYAITMISYAGGFIYYLRNRKNLSSRFLTITLFLLPLLIIATIYRFSPSPLNILISHRAYEFGYISIGPLSALFFLLVIRWRTRIAHILRLSAIPVCIVIMMILGPLAGAMHPLILPQTSEVVSSNALSMGGWINESVVGEDYVIGDKLVSFVLRGYWDRPVVTYPELFAGHGFSLPNSIQPYMDSKSVYAVTYIYMTEIYEANLSKFDTSPHFSRIYSNGLFGVHKVTVSNTSLRLR